MRLLPHVMIMGDRTGGGSGFPFTTELPIGWSVRFFPLARSLMQTRNIQSLALTRIRK